APRPSLAPFGSRATPEISIRRRSDISCDYVELHAQSAFSFLRASSLPEDLAHAAANAGHAVFGLADAGGFYGTPRFHTKARRAGLRPLVGAEIEVDGGGRVALLCEDRRGYQIVAGGGVRHATPQGKPLFDALSCIRLKTTLDDAGRRLSRNAERHVRPPREMANLFRDLPEAVRATRAVAERCAYTLDDL